MDERRRIYRSFVDLHGHRVQPTETPIALVHFYKGRLPADAGALLTMDMDDLVADDSPRGDLDAVARGFAAVVAVPTWPFAHAFALTDRVFLESLREDVATGLPSFLIDP